VLIINILCRHKLIGLKQPVFQEQTGQEEQESGYGEKQGLFV